MKNLTDFSRDITAVQSIPVVAEMLDIICQTTGMGFAAVARVTDDRWIACAVADKIAFGLEPGGELKLETTICHEIRQHRQPVAFDDVRTDMLYSDHHTPKLYGLESYISVPLVLKDGRFFGTLCAIDPKPHMVNNPQILAMFRFYAELLAFHLQAAEQLENTELLLGQERQTAELREQFIAVLGHDLRNPVGAVRNVGQLLKTGKLPETEMKRFGGVLINSAQRMGGLIDNVTDLARGRLGGGIGLIISETDLGPVLQHIIEELQLSWPERVISSDLQLAAPVSADGKRLAQLFSNLLSNALSHGDPAEPVRITAMQTDNELQLQVSNTGTPIPETLLPDLFAPFVRHNAAGHKEGLGLGLYISAEIAKAHQGKIGVSSDSEATVFTFRMPL